MIECYCMDMDNSFLNVLYCAASIFCGRLVHDFVKLNVCDKK